MTEIKNIKAAKAFEEFSNTLQIGNDSIVGLTTDIETIQGQLQSAKADKSSLTNQVSIAAFVAVLAAGSVAAFDEKFPKDLFKRSKDADKCGTYHRFYGAYSKAVAVASYLLSHNQIIFDATEHEPEQTISLESVQGSEVDMLKPISSLYSQMKAQTKLALEKAEQEAREMEVNLTAAITAANEGHTVPGLTKDQMQALKGSNIDGLQDDYGKMGLKSFAEGGRRYLADKAEQEAAEQAAEARLDMVAELIRDLNTGQAFLPDNVVVRLAAAAKKSIDAKVKGKETIAA